MGRVIFLLEERSMQAFLEALLPRLFPDLSFHCIPHEGKSDLERSISNTLRQWQEPNAKFVILRDNDGGDCFELKERLRQLCQRGGRDDTLIRIVCQELEAWYLSDPGAMADAFGNEQLRKVGRRASYRNPEVRPKPSEDVERLIPDFQKIAGARRMGAHLSREKNSSHSFAVFLNGIEKLHAECA